jgi:hypothetical protein
LVKELGGIRKAMKELKIGYATMNKYLTSGEYFKLHDGSLVKLVRSRSD